MRSSRDSPVWTCGRADKAFRPSLSDDQLAQFSIADTAAANEAVKSKQIDVHQEPCTPWQLRHDITNQALHQARASQGETPLTQG